MPDIVPLSDARKEMLHDGLRESQPVLNLDMIYKSQGDGCRRVDILKGVDLKVFSGQSVALIGSSGSGKSTLLHIAALLDKPTQGCVWIDGQNTSSLKDAECTAIRRHKIGFVYQAHRLMSEFSALENVAMPQWIAGVSLPGVLDRANELLTMVGLKDRVHHRSGELSGGEQQRVAIARAIANVPSLLLADEPTGNLDPKNASRVFGVLLEIIQNTGLSAIIATHDPALASLMERRLILADGILQDA